MVFNKLLQKGAGNTERGVERCFALTVLLPAEHSLPCAVKLVRATTNAKSLSMAVPMACHHCSLAKVWSFTGPALLHSKVTFLLAICLGGLGNLLATFQAL